MKTVCICLPENPTEIENAKKHFEEMEVGPVEFFWGINAKVAGLATEHTYEVDNPGTGFKIGYKPTGIWLSHYMLWSALARDNDEHIMVLETDARFLPGWKEKLANALKAIPSNFDMLYPGHCCVHAHNYIGSVMGDGVEVWETKNIQCSHCYIVRRWALQVLLRTLRKVWAPIDIQLQFECFPHLKTYAIVPRIVEQFNTDIGL